MRTIAPLLLFPVLLFFIACGGTTKTPEKIDSVKKDSPRQATKVTPPQPVAPKPIDLLRKYKVEIISYENHKNSPFEGRAFPEKITFPVIDRVTPDSTQLAKLAALLDPALACHDSTESECYEPHHAILFSDKDNKLKGYIEVCFTCRGSSNHSEFSMCNDRIEALRKIVRACGITYYTNK